MRCKRAANYQETPPVWLLARSITRPATDKCHLAEELRKTAGEKRRDVECGFFGSIDQLPQRGSFWLMLVYVICFWPGCVKLPFCVG